MRIGVVAIVESHQLQYLRDRGGNAVLTLANDLQRKGHVLIHRQLWKQAEILEDVPNGLTQRVDLLAGKLIDVEIIKVNIAFSYVAIAHHQLQEGGLTGTAWTDQESEFTIRNLERHPVKCWAGLGGVGLSHVVESNHANHCSNQS